MRTLLVDAFIGVVAVMVAAPLIAAVDGALANDFALILGAPVAATAPVWAVHKLKRSR